MLNQTSFRLKNTLLPTDSSAKVTEVINKKNEHGENYLPTFVHETVVITNEDRTVMETTKASCQDGVITFSKRGLSDDEKETVIEKRKLTWNPGALCFVTYGAGDAIDKEGDNIRGGKQTYTGEIVSTNSATFQGKLITRGGIEYPSFATFELLEQYQSPFAGMFAIVEDDGELYKYNANMQSWSQVTTSTPTITPEATNTISGKVKRAGFQEFATNSNLENQEINQKVVVMEMISLGFGIQYDAIVKSDAKYGYSKVSQAIQAGAKKIGVIGRVDEDTRWEPIGKTIELIEGIGGGARVTFDANLCRTSNVITSIGESNTIEIYGVNDGWEEKIETSLVKNIELKFMDVGQSFPTEEHNGQAYFKESPILKRGLKLEDCKLSIPGGTGEFCFNNGMLLILENCTVTQTGNARSLSSFYKKTTDSLIAIKGRNTCQVGDNARLNICLRNEGFLNGKLVLDLNGQIFDSGGSQGCFGISLRGSGERIIYSGERGPKLQQVDSGIQIKGYGFLNLTGLGSTSLTVYGLRSLDVSTQTVTIMEIATGKYRDLKRRVITSSDSGKIIFQLPTSLSNYVTLEDCKFEGARNSRISMRFENTCPLHFQTCQIGGKIEMQNRSVCSFVSPFSVGGSGTVVFGTSTSGKIYAGSSISYENSGGTHNQY